MRRSWIIGVVLTAAFAVPSFALVFQQMAQEQPHKIELTGASGAVTITNSKDGEAIVTADGLLPGTSKAGLVSITNTGEDPETLQLDSGDVADTPGPAGGKLSERLRLRVEDISDDQHPVQVFSGALGGLHGEDLGTLAKDESRTYRFVVTFPDGGANGADNAFQGSSATITFDWTAGEGGPTPPAADAPFTDQIAFDGPVSYWPLTVSGATITDVVGTNNGTWTGAVSPSTGPTPGDSPAATFGGVDAHGSIPSVPASPSGYTLGAWVKPTTTNDMTIIAHPSSGTLAITGGHFTFTHGSVTLKAPDTFAAGKWHQVLGTWDSAHNRARLFVDGELVDEAEATDVPSGSERLWIGRDVHGAPFFQGSMAHLMVFDRPLSRARIAAEFAAGKVTAADPVAEPSTPESKPSTDSAVAPTSDTPPSGDTGGADPNTGTGVGGQAGTDTSCTAQSTVKATKPTKKKKKKKKKRAKKAHGKPKPAKAATYGKATAAACGSAASKNPKPVKKKKPATKRKPARKRS